MSVYDTVRGAIINRRQVVATYRGYTREMCPHAIGTKRGKPATKGRGGRPGKPATPDEEHALFYQFGGGTQSGLQPPGSPANWRCIKLDELSNVSTRSGPWHTAGPSHSRPQTCVDDVDVEVT
jgi:hypothetical protein